MDKNFLIEELYNMIGLLEFYEETKQFTKVVELEKRINQYMKLLKG
ncbi:hypothetical protein [Clostridium sp.]